jgi:hypothetical protein
MGDGGRVQKPGTAKIELPQGRTADVALPSASRRLDGRDALQPLTDPMRYVRAEKAEAAASIDRSLKAWRARSGAGQANPTAIPQGGGTSLAGDVRARLEPALGADLSGAKIHTGADSAKAADKLGARAFTVGSDVHFGAGEYQPGTKEGDRLIAHEMTHTVQAKASGVQRKAGTPVNDDAGLEHEADAMGAKAAGGAHEVSQPHEPAEKEADAAADHAVDKLHGGGGKAGANGDAKPAGKEAAPPVAAKLDSNKIHLAGKDALKGPKKNELGTGPETAAVRVGNAAQAGIKRPPQHHVFPQEQRAWFKAHGLDVDAYCVNVDQARHEAIHTMGWNPQVMDLLKDAEQKKGKGKQLTVGEMVALVKGLMVTFKIDKLPFVQYGSERPQT